MELDGDTDKGNIRLQLVEIVCDVDELPSAPLFDAPESAGNWNGFT